MTDPEPTKFATVPTPEEMKAASEKVMNFWVGALSPMWVPFWAASSFGLSAWAMTQSLGKSEGLMKEIPEMAKMAPKWPGFMGVWGALTPSQSLDKTVDAVKPVVEAADAAVVDMVTSTAKAAEKVVDEASGAVVQAVDAAPEPKVVFDPVVEAPVAIQPAAVEAPAVLKEAAKAAPKPATPKATPKPIAKAVSAVKPKRP
ncbi:hypothetical protein [Asticcacaulis sp. 201]|uniref:hypothetical protein n=1 Tax=Asticcacaulis sp. 201 TaxID=3028787 RepID=UPI002916650E|nr:hypothetical protein [Asticcacaulis sp. 201]MDV6333096.1 hypothetical protein [Asticcacaulis sp. 201]